jgi:hypothetical protein
VAGTIGLLVVAGWTFDVPAMKSVAPGFIAMQPWTALAILFAAAALWLAASDAPAARAASAMALHELATNAIKYGAWSATTGQVNVRWEIIGDVEPHLLMVWSEDRGPSVVAPIVRGFGTRMIERSLAHDLGGTAQVAFNSAALTCTIDAPLTGVVAAARVVPLPRVGRMEGNETWH